MRCTTTTSALSKAKAAILLALLLFPFVCHAQLLAPERLMTDLLEHTECVYRNGVLSTMPVEEAKKHRDVQVAYICSEQPKFGWQMRSKAENAVQTAYQIQVASAKELLLKGEADMWDSGKVSSNSNIAISYEGRPLKPNTCYYWRVSVWDNNNNASPFSEIKKFHTAKAFDNTMPRYPLTKEEEYPKSVSRLDNGHFIDFAKAAFGQLRMTLYSENANDTITLHLGEAQKDGRVDRQPGASVRYCQYEIPLKKGLHTYNLDIKPDSRNTDPRANESGVRPILMPEYIGEVYPFRYCEIENYNQPLHTQDIIRSSVSYPFDEEAAMFCSSDTIINKVWDLCKHSIKATTFCGVYVDGDRERIPYEADAYINQLSHYATDLEFSLARYTVDYLMEWPTWPTEWIMQSILMLWNDYMHTGDPALLKRHYPALHARTLSALADSTGLISTRTGKQTPEFLKSISFKGKAIRDIVDWPQSGALGIEKSEAGEADGYELTTYNTVVNAYHYRTLVLMAEIAKVLGETGNAEDYTLKAEKFKKTFNKAFFDKQKHCYRDGVESEHCSLHANMFPLAFDLVPEKHKSTVCALIESKGMACSVYGSQFLMDALYENDMDDHALSLLCSTGLRSWYNMIRTGSTITLEAWDARFKPNLDWNHAWGAAPANIIPRYIIGLQPTEAGYRKMRLKPQPATLESARAVIPTIQGSVHVSYNNKPGESFELSVEIPANTEMEILMPRISKSSTLSINGKTVKANKNGNRLTVTLGSGKYHLISAK